MKSVKKNITPNIAMGGWATEAIELTSLRNSSVVTECAVRVWLHVRLLSGRDS